MSYHSRVPTQAPGPRKSSATPAVGHSLPRREDHRLLTGSGKFFDDVPAPDALHLAFLRSPVAHATIRGLDTSAAGLASGVEAVLSAAALDIGPLTAPIEDPAAVPMRRPLLADSVVRFVGEPIVAVLASSRYDAEDACELIDVALGPLPPVADTDDALAAGAPVVHGYPSNVLYDSSVEAGDADEAFASAAATVERSFENPRYSALPIELRGTLAVPGEGGVLLWSSTQAPHKLSQTVAELLGLRTSSVRVIVPDVGVDLLAGELDLDPADIRGRNLLRPDELPYATVTNQHDGGDYPEALERVLAAIDYGGFREREHAARAEGRLLGIGLSCYAGYTGINSRVFHGRGMVGIAGYDSAYATIDGDGRATVWTTLPAIGPGLETTFAQMAADSLGLDVDAVRVALRHFGRRPARHRRVRQPQRDLRRRRDSLRLHGAPEPNPPGRRQTPRGGGRRSRDSRQRSASHRLPREASRSARR